MLGCLKLDKGRLDFFKILGAWFRQDLTKIYFAAEEQCCTLHAQGSAKRLGGYRVGSKVGQIIVLHNPLWYNRGID